MQEELKTMKTIFFKFLIILFFTFFNAEAKVSSEVKVHEVEVLGRSVIVEKNLKKARQLALDDALYLASLKGGAMIEGFSSVSNSTILNDQSIVKPTSNILDFKILSEKQKNEHFEIKILAVVGFNQPKSKCTSKPLNITVFKGQIFSDYSLPSNLLRSMYKWYDGFYEIIKTQKNIKIYDKSDVRLKDVIKSSANKEYDYNAAVNGLPEVEEGNFDKAIEYKNSLVKEQGYFSLNQFKNPLNIECHRNTTFEEIISEIPKFPTYTTEIPSISAFIAGTGTGGTLMGIQKGFEAQGMNTKIVAVEPAESPVMSGGEKGLHGIQGIGDGSKFLVDLDKVDNVITISTEEAKERALRLAKENGLFVGISAGANVLASERWIEKNNPNGIVVTILCDRGERYFSVL